MITATDLDVSASKICDTEVRETVEETGTVFAGRLLLQRGLDSEKLNHCGNLHNKLECRTVVSQSSEDIAVVPIQSSCY